MTKQEIIERLVKQSGIRKRQISYIVDNFLDHILSSCDNGDKVEIFDRKGNWYRVAPVDGGPEGWAHARWIWNDCNY